MILFKKYNKAKSRLHKAFACPDSEIKYSEYTLILGKKRSWIKSLLFKSAKPEIQSRIITDYTSKNKTAYIILK